MVLWFTATYKLFYSFVYSLSYFLSSPSVSLPASTAATLSSTSSSSTAKPPTNSSTTSTPFPTQLTLLCHLLLVLLPSSRLQIVPLFLLLPLLLFLFQLPLFCHLFLVLLPPHNIFFISFLFFSLYFLLSLGKKTLWTNFNIDKSLSNHHLVIM